MTRDPRMGERKKFGEKKAMSPLYCILRGAKRTNLKTILEMKK